MEFIKYTKIYFLISLIVLVPGLISLIFIGLRPSIDFTGGSLIEIQTRQPVSETQIRQSVADADLDLSSLVRSTDNSYLLRLKPIDQSQHDSLLVALNTSYEGVFSQRFETIGPTVGAELTKRAVMAVSLASLAIIAYIAWSFRSVPKPYSSWKFGITAIIALGHDLLVVLGLFSIFGHFFAVEVDALFVTALLTVIGFSVHDTLVVFDRIRQNLGKQPHLTFSQVADFSLTEPLGRSLNTSATVILTLTSLLLFGGSAIRWFVIALLIGIVSGTYSSIFNATPLLVLWTSRSKPVQK